MLEPVIGLEIHLALKTQSKMFCSCAADSFGEAPNVSTCPVCLGLPGSLPNVNREAVEKAIRFSLALNCRVNEVTQFHRKNYYYPDAPKNYQISQYDKPVGEGGWLELAPERRIGITRCHLEEDAGRLVHPLYASYSLADFNRAGAPLLEMVSEPDLKSPEEAREFLRQVRALARALGVSDADPEEGKMRADVNVSLRRPGEGLGVKVEVKNLNSFRNVQRALEYEIRRQGRILEDGGRVVQSTLGWDEGAQKTFLMRTKEEAADYRYFPDPDLPPMRVGRDWLEAIRLRTPEPPARKRERYLALGVRADDAEALAYDLGLSRFFDEALEHHRGSAQTLANWLLGDVTGHLNAQGRTLEGSSLLPEHLAALVALLEAGAISGKIAKDLLLEVMEGRDPKQLVAARSLAQITDRGALSSLVDEVLAAHPELVRRVQENPKAINALLGQVMKASGGQASPEAVRALLAERLKPAERV